jgi:hypothetical protein
MFFSIFFAFLLCLCLFYHSPLTIIGSTSGGCVRVFFDPRVSVKGAVTTAGRAPRREKDPSDYTAVGEIYNPHALPMYKVSGGPGMGRDGMSISLQLFPLPPFLPPSFFSSFPSPIY